MKRIPAGLTTLVSTAVIFLILSAMAHAAPLKGKNLPLFEAVTVDGKKVSQSTYAGKVLLVAVTSDACDACKKAAPRFNELSKAYERQGFQMLGLHYGTNYGIDKLKALVKEYHIGFTMALTDEKTVKNTLGIFSVPCYIVLDKKGTIAGIYRGFNDVNYKLIEKQVKSSLAE